MKNKLLIVVMIGMLGISLVACCNDNATDVPAADSNQESVQETQKEEPQQEETPQE